MQIFTEKGEIRITECQCYLVKPSCKSWLQVPNAGFSLIPDPFTCIQQSSDIVRILTTPLLRPSLEELEKLAEKLPLELKGDVHQNLLWH